MKKQLLFLVVLILLLISCKKRDTELKPLMTVINLITLEGIIDYESARQYIDVESVYKELSEELNRKPDELWKEKHDFNYKLGQSRKFTTCFRYDRYEIECEFSSNDSAQVTFHAKGSGRGLKRIIYTLTKRNEAWIVTALDFVKGDSKPKG